MLTPRRPVAIRQQQLDSANLQVGVDFAVFCFACTNPTEFLD
jgi:hypothetical protein